MTNYANFASIYANEVAKFESLGTEKAAIFAAKNVAERLGLSYSRVRQIAMQVAA